MLSNVGSREAIALPPNNTARWLRIRELTYNNRCSRKVPKGPE
jgi:hypothetical protein